MALDAIDLSNVTPAGENKSKKFYLSKEIFIRGWKESKVQTLMRSKEFFLSTSPLVGT
jgi:hypothetical protein